MMYSLISYAVSWLLSSKEKNNDDDIEADAADSHIIPEDSPFLVHAEEVKTRNIEGKISHMFHGHGLIDGDVYFSVDDVQGEDINIKVGDMVQATAVQIHEDGGWYARQVFASTQNWAVGIEEDETQAQREDKSVIMGKVTSYQYGQGKIDSHISFNEDVCTEGYVPYRGDWVSASVEETVEKRPGATEWDEVRHLLAVKVHQVNPLRTLETEGQVTAVMNDHGYINEQIFFPIDACANGFKPRRNDYVRAECVESTQGKCQWRATFIIPLSTKNNVYRNKQYRQSAQSSSKSWLVPGQRPKFHQQLKALPVKLPQFTIPDNLFRHVMDQEELTDYCPHLKTFSYANYAKRMSTLLYLEEVQMQLDIREFDLNRVCLHHVREYLALSVPGLAEGRPSVLIGDKVILSVPYDPDGPSYEGFVHELTSSDVHLKFSPEFHNRYNGEDYNIVFTFNRNTLRRCHQAVSLAVQFHGSKVLFPSQNELKPPQVKMLPVDEESTQHDDGKVHHKYTRSQRLYNHRQKTFQRSEKHSSSPSAFVHDKNDGHERPSKPMEQQSSRCCYIAFDSDKTLHTSVQFYNRKLNEEQKAAVSNILVGQCRPTPYVIFGPPGTGKTITVVEAILQIYFRVQSSRILACTPSNSAADLITERLHQSGVLQTSDMVRMNAFQRSLQNVPESILKYCYVPDDLRKISRHRIIICTCSMAGILYGLGLSAGHFTHVVVDECGQATEPECLIPVGLLSGADGQIVLAGDPKQLGPIVMSPFAKMYGLELSFLERLMNYELYQRDDGRFHDTSGFNPLLVTMLRKNYRSNPAILNLPSKLFYYDELQPFADSALVTSLADWPLLVTPGDPVIFHGMRGEDIRETDNPSWFNPGETLQVVRYFQGLLRENVSPDDIGIITPYRKQVQKIRFMIERLDLPDVKVGSVEEFQGQERQAIIISTVRSNEKLIGFDVRHSLGFLSNPKRFNVAITRAQALLIIIGNPYVLAEDTNWRLLIEECHERGVYTGCDLPDLKVYETE